jgi:hypothetical protein
MEIQKFKDQLIAFDCNTNTINATDMAKAYDKKPADFLRLESTKAFIEALENDMSENHITFISVKGRHSDGRTQGTWMGELLALKFASWLNPEFELFIFKTFRSVLYDLINEERAKNLKQQRELDYFWDKEDQSDLYR